MVNQFPSLPESMRNVNLNVLRSKVAHDSASGPLQLQASWRSRNDDTKATGIGKIVLFDLFLLLGGGGGG